MLRLPRISLPLSSASRPAVRVESEPAPASHPAAFALEALEPRVLLSADAALLMGPAISAPASPEVSQAVIESSGSDCVVTNPGLAYDPQDQIASLFGESTADPISSSTPTPQVESSGPGVLAPDTSTTEIGSTTSDPAKPGALLQGAPGAFAFQSAATQLVETLRAANGPPGGEWVLGDGVLPLHVQLRVLTDNGALLLEV